MKHILFVCSGNTCRSPLAEGIANTVLPKKTGLDILASSAGTSTMEGMPASANSVAVALEHGIDLSGHRSRLLTRELVRRADLILTMGEKHRETVGILDTAARAYTATLAGFCGQSMEDVSDPIGGDLAAYRQTYELIEECVEVLARELASFDGWKK